MATHCVFAVSSKKGMDTLRDNFKYYHLVAWGIPAVFTAVPYLLPLITPDLGPAFAPLTPWCWISANYSAWRIILFYGPLWMIFIYNVSAYTYVGHKLFKFSRQQARVDDFSISRQERQNVERLRKSTTRFALKTFVYVLVFLVTWVASTTNRVHNLVAPDSPIFLLSLLQTSTIALQGFLNAIVFFAFVWSDWNEKHLDRQTRSETPTTRPFSILIPSDEIKEEKTQRWLDR